MEQKQEPKLLTEGKKSAVGQWIGAGIIVLALVALGYFIVSNKAQAPAASTSDEEAVLTEEEGVGATHAFEWSFAIVGGNPSSGADKTEVTFTHDGVAKVIGTYEGHCLVVGDGTNTWQLAADELTGVICSWAGEGHEVGVFYESGAYVVKHGTIKEADGEEQAFRGSYETLFTI